MNLQKLFEMQRELDARIEQEHPRKPGEDRLAKKILALLVELGELANEARFFKYWSHDQEPRIKDYKQIKCKWCNGSGDDGTGVCPDCKSSGDVYKEYNPLLEEYVDCLHFILSIGNDLNLSEIEFQFNENEFTSTLEAFRHTINWAVNLDYLLFDADTLFKPRKTYFWLLNSFVWLGEQLGFAWEQIEQAYFQKNQLNHERLDNGY